MAALTAQGRLEQPGVGALVVEPAIVEHHQSQQTAQPARIAEVASPRADGLVEPAKKALDRTRRAGHTDPTLRGAGPHLRPFRDDPGAERGSGRRVGRGGGHERVPALRAI